MTRALSTCVAALAAASLSGQEYRNGSFLQTNNVPFGTYQRADLNGSGTTDFLIYDFSSGVYTILDPDLTSSSATVTQAAPLTAFGTFGGFLDLGGIADLDGDGSLDVVIEFNGIFSFGGVFTMMNDGNGNLGAPQLLVQAVGKIINAAVGDFDGDGDADVGVGLPDSYSDDQLLIFLQDQGALSLGHTQTVTQIGQMFAGDFDGDGADEVAWLGTSGELRLLPGGTGFTAPEVVVSIAAGLTGGITGDFDSDGRDDLILQSNSPWALCAHWGDATSYLSAAQNLPTNSSQRSDFLGAFDVDGDGNDDLLMVIRNNYAGYVLLRNGGDRRFSPQPYQTTMGGFLIDLDLDGDLDQLVPQFYGGGYQRQVNLSRYGVACAGVVGNPQLDLPAALPNSPGFGLTLRQAAPSVPAVLVLASTGTPAPCGPQVGIASRLFLDTATLAGVTSAAGSAFFSLPLLASAPQGPFFAQALVFDPSGTLTIPGHTLATTGGRAFLVY